MLQPALLGALTVAEDYVLGLIKARNKKPLPQEFPLHQTATTYDEDDEVEVSRSAAIDHYLELRQVIDKRIQAITTSDPQATFHINPASPNII